MFKICCRKLYAEFNKRLDLRSKFVDLEKLSKRNLNISNLEYIEKIGRHLHPEDEDQLIMLNLPFENDYLLPQYLTKNAQKILLFLNKSCQKYTGLNENKNLIVIKNVDLRKLQPFQTVKKESNVTIYSEIINHIQMRTWTDKPTAKLFMAIPDNSKQILRSFFSQIIYKSNLFSKGRVELYLLITELEFKRIELGSKRERFFVILYNLIFDYELLDKFYWSDLQITHSKQQIKMNEYCYFVKLTPKISLFNDFSTNELVYFMSFLKKSSVSKEKLVISFFEVWFPGIGLKLIDLDYSIFTKFEELELDDYIKIFNYLMKEERDTFLEIITDNF